MKRKSGTIVPSISAKKPKVTDKNHNVVNKVNGRPKNNGKAKDDVKQVKISEADSTVVVVQNNVLPAVVPVSSATKKGRGRPSAVRIPALKLKIMSYSVVGSVLTVGEGSTGQLGLGPDIMDRGRFSKVSLPSGCVQVCAGGMHTVCLTQDGKVYSFGCNDESALGRMTSDEDECMEPGLVEIGERIALVSAGDSHSAALTESGKVFMWGVFRDSSGSLDKQGSAVKMEKPTLVEGIPASVVKVVSGNDHLVCLTLEGDIYSLGNGEQGQLGRVSSYFVQRGGRRGMDMLVKPAKVFFKRKLKFSDVWVGQYCTFAKENETGDVYAWGLNNYCQLGFDDLEMRFVPEKVQCFDRAKGWKMISCGQHHTVALDNNGQVYGLGRKEYGRLGLGEEGEDAKTPTAVPTLAGVRCTGVSAGTSVSFAVTEKGEVYSWGMGSGKQLGHGADEDDVWTPKLVEGKQLEKRQAAMVSAGGQHAVMLLRD